MRPHLLPLLLVLASALVAQEGVDAPFPRLDPEGPSVLDPEDLAAPAGALSLGDLSLREDLPAVVDGDTIRVSGLDASLRLLGIDTEETFKREEMRLAAAADWKAYLAARYAGEDPARPPKYGTPMGERARVFAERFFADEDLVRLEYDGLDRKRGYYGRHLVHVLVEKDGRFVHFNVEVVRQGLSPYFEKYGHSKRYHEAFLAAETEARAARRGIWSARPLALCYPDYETARLAWWERRARALERAEAEAAADPRVFLLGVEATWPALIAIAESKDEADRTVTVIGSPSVYRRLNGELGAVFLGHQNRKDFAVVGPFAHMETHPLLEMAGEIVRVTGEVRLHRGRPQFLITAEQLPESPNPSVRCELVETD